jgi:hypothetical protein
MAGKDEYENAMPIDFSSPASHAVAITPHATNELAHYTRAIYVGGAGNITLVTVGDETVQFVGVLAGTILPVRTKIVTTATTATSLVGLY